MGEEVATSGPNLEELKARYGKIYKIAFDETDVFYIRRLKRQEHRKILESLESADPRTAQDLLEEKVVETVVVYPPLALDFFSTSPTGYVSWIAQKVVEVSGFNKSVEAVEV